MTVIYIRTLTQLHDFHGLLLDLGARLRLEVLEDGVGHRDFAQIYRGGVYYFILCL